MQSHTTAADTCSICGACCRAYLVPVSGYDIWRIWKNRKLSPSQFAVAVRVAVPQVHSFRLLHGGPYYSLVLAKQGAMLEGQPCVFLVRTPGGRHVCGIYLDRPGVCRTYPMAVAPEGVVQRPEALCPIGTWSSDEPKQASWREAIDQYQTENTVYAEFVSAWNEHIDRQENARFDLRTYYASLLEAYDLIALVDVELSDGSRAYRPAVERVLKRKLARIRAEEFRLPPDPVG